MWLLTHSLVTQVQRENSRFRALMATQLSAAGEEHAPVVSAAGEVSAAR